MNLIKPDVLIDTRDRVRSEVRMESAASDGLANLTKPNIPAALENFSSTPIHSTARETEHA